jgi:hypothetical protein
MAMEQYELITFPYHADRFQRHLGQQCKVQEIAIIMQMIYFISSWSVRDGN